MSQFTSNTQDSESFSRRMIRRAINAVVVTCPENYREIYDNACIHEYGGNPDTITNKDANVIMVNAIRHNYSNYDCFLSMVNRVDIYPNNRAYMMYKNATLEKIPKAYPFLSKYCQSQKRRVDMVKVIRNII